ncbi:hypothetical protein LMANV2_500016 [Leptospira interrogans serovar Manilae]|uniref:Uncharacterized protein n=1 Tax=Leptospira interrogans serovar Manilae TaxID=214675 RepID=A0AAQ1P0J8_LEPIR|nr:hypothetical protein LMANV2_500016 [Leptospira interrogans serovar Manilae]
MISLSTVNLEVGKRNADANDNLSDANYYRVPLIFIVNHCFNAKY